MLCMNCHQEHKVSSEHRRILEAAGWVKSGKLAFCPGCIEEDRQARYTDVGSATYSPLRGGSVQPSPNHWELTMVKSDGILVKKTL